MSTAATSTTASSEAVTPIVGSTAFADVPAPTIESNVARTTTKTTTTTSLEEYVGIEHQTSKRSTTAAAAAASNANKREQQQRKNSQSSNNSNTMSNEAVVDDVGANEQQQVVETLVSEITASTSRLQCEDASVSNVALAPQNETINNAVGGTTTSNSNSNTQAALQENQEGMVEHGDDGNDHNNNTSQDVTVENGKTATSTTSSKDVEATDKNAETTGRDVSTVDSDVVARDDNDDDDETDLRNPQRRIWIVTTAAMPWRTGTAVNPLMRALYLTRGRPKHFVTLVIPWLDDVESQKKLFGGHVFDNRNGQEEWIRDFCRTRANCSEEESNLRILFYSSKYHNTLGSIFPSEDICGLIPDEEADVAILEEPEHLNWFRIPSNPSGSTLVKKSNSTPSNSSDEQGEEANSNSNSPDSPDTSSHGVEVVYGKEPDVKERNHLGWAIKFRYVIGILHTNYAAYMGQYGFGTSIIAAPALSLLSSIVVRAYCNRVIRLSAALPPLAPHKEVTSNVHGVRSEFLQAPVLKMPSSTTAQTDPLPVDVQNLTLPPMPRLAAIYFIGKVIWAKGFDKVLEVEELFRQKTGNYFALDVYGGGSDEKAIKRAFFGRKGGTSTPPLPRSPSGCESPPSETKELASKVFGSTESIRGLLLHAKQAFDAAVLECSTTLGDNSETSDHQDGQGVASTSDHQDVQVVASPSTSVEARAVDSTSNKNGNSNTNPLSVFGDLSGKSVTTGLAVSKAVYKLADKLVKAGMDMTFDNDERAIHDANKDEVASNNKKGLVFAPPRSRFEWRRTPIPARFLGVVDHVEIRDIVEHKIFLNMSTTEVLCTTTAEALAMGKFVVLPNHPSNEFFFQFPNCLVYDSMEECAEKLRWALEHDPQPLSDDHIRAFSWEGATDRLFDAAIMTAEEKKNRNVTDKEDKGVARFHVESMLKGHLLSKFFAGEM